MGGGRERVCAGELQSRMRRCYNWTDYGTAFAGVRVVEMTGAEVKGVCFGREWNSGLARVFGCEPGSPCQRAVFLKAVLQL
jgi:hypothetical protein